MKTKKAKTAAIVIAIATAIALSGTFAWQSISQMARNEATEPTNPGGRLHDDFSGYEATDTKDIYVENFGNQPIYARVRLDEYMEIGEGAGLKGTVGEDGAITPNPENQAVPLVTDAKIDDVTTWTTHIPGDAPDAGAETDFTDPGKTFHTYWTWTMGGQAGDNPEGKTVYMPTFNKNRDSLKADINGTLAGLDKDPTTGEQYDDYHKYTVGDTADRVRDTDTDTYPNGATYDIDADTTDECGPYGGAGGAGVDGVNYGMAEETHTAQETMKSSVITMAEYKTKTEAQKAEFQGWVYDADGWAYWSQPIQPGTPTEEDEFVTNATGLLLDRIVLEHKPSDTWYYGINAVGQFITADDLGRADEPKTGFYDPNGGLAPSEDALTLLDFIGVNTASVKGAITPAASVTVGDEAQRLTYAVQGMSLDLSSSVEVAGVDSPVQDVTWTVTGNTDETTTIDGPILGARAADAPGGTFVLKVGAAETGVLRLTARSRAYDGLKAVLILPVKKLAYTVTVTPEVGATSILPGGTKGFTATLTSNNPALTLPQEFTWTLDKTYVSGTAVAANEADATKATLTVAALETAEAITVKATPKDSAYSTLSGSANILVTKVFYNVDILDSGGTTVKGKEVTMKDGQEITFNKVVSSYPTGQTPTDSWTWSSSDTTGKITVDQTGKVSVAFGTATGATATITATNSDYTPALTASFTVKVQLRNYTVTINQANPAVFIGQTHEFTASVTADSGTDPDDVVEWGVSGNSDTKTKFTDNILTVGADETADTLTVTATHVTGASDTATVTVDKPTYTLDIKNTAETPVSVKDQTVKMKRGDSATFTLDITSEPTGYKPSGTWSATSSKDASATASISGTTVTINVPANATLGDTVITVQNSDDASLKVTFKVEAILTDIMTVDGIEYYVLVNNATITGKAAGQTTASSHKAALLLTKDVQSMRAFGSSCRWMNSDIRKYLNGTDGSNWLAGKTLTQSKAIKVKIQTRQSSGATTFDPTEDTVFLLSSADVCDQYQSGSSDNGYAWSSCAAAEYTYNGARIPYFATGKNADENRIAYFYNNNVKIPKGWWLRSPSGPLSGETCADYAGTVAYATTTNTLGVRPAFWYNLDS